MLILTRIWRIFWHEYWGHITRRSYLMFTFGFPLFMVSAPLGGGVILFLAIRNAMPPTDPRPIGVVDQVGLFATAAYPDDPVEALPFETVPEAAAALGNFSRTTIRSPDLSTRQQGTGSKAGAPTASPVRTLKQA